MRNRISTILFSAFCICGLLFSCAEDNSTEFGSRETSNVTIEYPFDVISIYVNEETIIAPKVTQTMEGAYDLSYEWQFSNPDVDYTDEIPVISTDSVLKYTFNDLGEYILTLRAYNDTHSTSKIMKLKVQTRFQNGVCVLGVNEDTGVADISMMETLSLEDIEAGIQPQIVQDCFRRVTPDLDMNNALQIIEMVNFLVLPTDDGKIYKFDRNTLELYSVLEPEKKVLRIFEPDRRPDLNPSRNSVYADDGRMYMYNPIFDQILDKASNVDDFDNDGWDFVISSNQGESRREIYLVDDDKPRFSTFDGRGILDYTDNVLVNQEFINICAGKGHLNDLIFFTRDVSDPTKITITDTRWWITSVNKLTTYNTSNLKLTRESEISFTSANIVYFEEGNNGSGIYAWNRAVEDQLPETPSITVDGQITCMGLSENGWQLYVGVYNPEASGRKGSIYIYDASNSSLVAKYEGVCDKPVEIFHKN